MYLELRELSSGDGGRGGLNKTLIKNINIRLPREIKEQHAIAEVLTAMDEEIESLKIEKDKMIQIKEGAMDDLLTGRVRLKVWGGKGYVCWFRKKTEDNAKQLYDILELVNRVFLNMACDGIEADKKVRSNCMCLLNEYNEVKDKDDKRQKLLKTLEENNNNIRISSVELVKR